MSSEPLAQRWKRDREYIEAVKQIRPEQPLPDHFHQVKIRRRNHANIYANGADAAEPLGFLFLQDAQQLGLQFEGEVAHLVQE